MCVIIIDLRPCSKKNKEQINTHNSDQTIG